VRYGAVSILHKMKRDRAHETIPSIGAVAAVKAKGKSSFDLETFLATTNGGRSITNYKKDATIISQGDPCDGIFYIREGTCKVTVVSDTGKEAVVALHEKGAFFAEGCLNGQVRHLATIKAMTDCEIMRFDKKTMAQAVHDEPEFAEFFMCYLLTRNSRVEADLVDQLFNSSEKRLARMLLLMANFGKEGKPELVIAKVSQETLAEMIGTTRSRVNFFMNKFRKLGFIEYNGELIVHNSLLNVVLHGDPEIRREKLGTDGANGPSPSLRHPQP
jgi:CRP/FNR family cyclic AMP-dependent transcriptional regulator